MTIDGGECSPLYTEGSCVSTRGAQCGSVIVKWSHHVTWQVVSGATSQVVLEIEWCLRSSGT